MKDVKRKIGLIIEIPTFMHGTTPLDEDDRFLEITAQIISDIKSACANSKGKKTFFHVLIDSADKEPPIVVEALRQIDKEIKKSYSDAIYYTTLENKHWTTKEPSIFSGSDEERFVANEIITGECGVIVSGIWRETNRHRDLLYYIKQRKAIYRSVKPGNWRKWYTVDDKKEWAKLRGKRGVLTKSFLESSSETQKKSLPISAFDVESSGDKDSANIDGANWIHPTSFDTCDSTNIFEDWVVAISGMAYACSEINMIHRGQQTINSFEMCQNHLQYWTNIATNLSKGMPYKFELNNDSNLIDVKIPRRITGCKNEQCEELGYCKSVFAAQTMFSWYKKLGVLTAFIGDEWEIV